MFILWKETGPEKKETILEQKETKVTKDESPTLKPASQGMKKPRTVVTKGPRTVASRGRPLKTAKALPVSEFFVSFAAFCSNVLMQAILRAPAPELEWLLSLRVMERAQSRLLWAGQRDAHVSWPTLRGSNPRSRKRSTMLATPSRAIASPCTFVSGRTTGAAVAFQGAWSEAGALENRDQAFGLVKAWQLNLKEVDDLPSRSVWCYGV